MTQRGRIMIVTLDDSSATLEVTVFGELYEANRQLFKEDEFLAVQGRISEDRFTGGLRITADNVLDIAGARVQFGKQLRISLTEPIDMIALQDALAPRVSKDGLPLLMRYKVNDVEFEMRLGEKWRARPDDDLTRLLMSDLKARDVTVEY